MEKTVPLSNLQLELLKLYSMNIDDSDLAKIKSLISRFFADKAINAADKTWKEKGYTQDDADQWLTTHSR